MTAPLVIAMSQGKEWSSIPDEAWQYSLVAAKQHRIDESILRELLR
ncbi:MAG: hypothetical protein JW925_10720 [Syntrophaceae bacterium]|nr:hypothetical protein [Syntrophaceae bacterium]